MDAKTFNGYLQNAENEFKSKGIVPTQLQLYEFALQKIKESYDVVINKEYIKRKKLIDKYTDDLFFGFKQYVDGLFKELNTVLDEKLKNQSL